MLVNVDIFIQKGRDRSMKYNVVKYMVVWIYTYGSIRSGECFIYHFFVNILTSFLRESSGSQIAKESVDFRHICYTYRLKKIKKSHDIIVDNLITYSKHKNFTINLFPCHFNNTL